MPEGQGQLHIVLFPAAGASRRGNLLSPSGDLGMIFAYKNSQVHPKRRALILSEKERDLNFF
jgi:hypothetical protein